MAEKYYVNKSLSHIKLHSDENVWWHYSFLKLSDLD